MKFLLAALSLSLTALLWLKADDVNLAYDASPATNQLGHRIYFSTSTNPAAIATQFIFIPKPGTTGTITNLGAGIWYFQATCLVTGNFESDPSNTATYTNKHFGPVNLRISGSTSNNTAAIWVERNSDTVVVQWSKDLSNWTDWASVKSLDVNYPIEKSIFLAGLKPANATSWRALSPPPTPLIAPSLLPTGMRLSGTPPIP